MEHWMRNALIKSHRRKARKVADQQQQLQEKGPSLADLHSFSLKEFYVIFILWALAIATSLVAFLYEISLFARGWITDKCVLIIVGLKQHSSIDWWTLRQ